MAKYISESEVRALIEESEARLRKYIKNLLADRGLDSQPNTQLMVVSEDDKKAIVARAMQGVATYIQKEVITKIDDLREVVNAQTLDGDELVTEYRRRLHSTISGDGEETLKITGKVESRSEAEQKLREFRKKNLFFNDGDSE